jgi:hypothetical protein
MYLTPSATKGCLRRTRVSKVPWRNELKSGRSEIRQIARRQAATVDPGNGGNHAIGCRHAESLPGRCTHDVAIGQRRLLSQSEDPASKPMPPIGKASLQPGGTSIWQNLLNAKGDFCNCDGRQGQFGVMTDEPRYHCRVG